MREQERKKGRHDEGQYPNRENDEHLGMANPLLLFLVGDKKFLEWDAVWDLRSDVCRIFFRYYFYS